jgi:hypothetical protein
MGYDIPLHVHNHVENILKHVFFYVHDIKVMVEEIGLPIRKLLKKDFVLSNYGSN